MQGKQSVHTLEIVDSSNSKLARRRFIQIWQGINALLGIGLVAALAFSFTFTTLEPWDDDGNFLQAYHDFLSGHALYDQVFSPYGPFSFFSAALVARIDAANVTHDNFRWAMLVVWIAIASLLSAVVWRWTRRSSAALVVLLLVGFRLKGLPKSVGHPQLWIILAVALLVWLGLDWIFLPDKRSHALWTGLFLGVVLLCKINMGVLVSTAIALAVSLQLRGRLRMMACTLFATAAMGFGFLLLVKTSAPSEKFFVVAYLGSLLAPLAIAIHRHVEQELLTRSLLWMLAGLGTCLCAGVAVTLVSGSTIRGLLDGFVMTPALFAKTFYYAFQDPTRRGSILLSTVGLAAAAIAISNRRRLADLAPKWVGLAKVACGTGLVYAFYHDQREALTGSLLFMWLLIVGPPRMSDAAYSNRLVLALLCPLFSLQFFPMAGQQVDWGTLLPVTTAGVLLADGANSVERVSLRVPWSRLTTVIARGTVPLLVICLFVLVGKQTLVRCKRWQGSQSVNLRGTHWVRLPPSDVARLTVTTSQVQRNCESVLMIPGLYSFSLWSGVPPAEEKRFDAWPFLWPFEVQKNDLPKLRQQKRGCVLVSQDMYKFFRYHVVSPGNDELLTEVQKTMVPIFAFQNDLTLYRASQIP
jgi:hypothetical protein